MSYLKAARQLLIRERVGLCLLTIHDWEFGGLPPMWGRCRRCGRRK